jgi:hypothetical protein
MCDDSFFLVTAVAVSLNDIKSDTGELLAGLVCTVFHMHLDKMVRAVITGLYLHGLEAKRCNRPFEPIFTGTSVRCKTVEFRITMPLGKIR